MGIEQYCLALVDAVHRPSRVDDILAGGGANQVTVSASDPASFDVLVEATQLSENQQWAELCSFAEKFLAAAPQMTELTSLKLLYARALVHIGRSEEAGLQAAAAAVSSSADDTVFAALAFAQECFQHYDDDAAFGCARYYVDRAVVRLHQAPSDPAALEFMATGLRNLAYALQECAEYRMHPGDVPAILTLWEWILWVDLRRLEFSGDRFPDMVTDCVATQAYCMSCLLQYQLAANLYVTAAELHIEFGDIPGAISVYSQYTEAMGEWPKRYDRSSQYEEICAKLREDLW